jgi:hypothetical protein
VAEVTLRREIQADFAALPSDDHRRQAVGFLIRLRDAPLLGQPLGHHPGVGDLSDCRKVYFDRAPNRPPGFRIVYRLRPSAEEPDEVDVIAIGPRADAEVYLESVRRLGRV